ncbi:hypothetical protein [Escherichia coli]|nr:hypothetical protein [Escherichia coli]
MKEINAKFAPKGVFESKIKESQIDELMIALEDTNENGKAANDDVAASTTVSDEYLKELDVLLAM